MLDQVNDKMTTASQNSVNPTVCSSDFDGTNKSVEEAGLAFSFTEAIRSKLMESYTEIQQMQF